MRFAKLEGAGNDYIFPLDDEAIPDPTRAARALSDRHRGVGADGLIRILPAPEADARMEIYNADGSRAEMCGNGLRCAALYLRRFLGLQRSPLRIETDAGPRAVEVLLEGGRFAGARAEIGAPRFPRVEGVPGDAAGRTGPIELEAAGARLRGCAVSLGNPHLVVLVENLEETPVAVWGPALETHPLFPARTNVEFVRVLGPGEIALRVWERGSGETLACGSGAAAALAACAEAGRTARSVTAHLGGGDLEVAWRRGGSIWVAGPAREAFRGEVDLERLIAEVEAALRVP